MAMRNCKTALLHVAYFAGAIWIGAHELALHNITDSDVYKGPTESPVAYPLNPSVVPSVEPLQQSTSISTIFDTPTVTTTQYITVTRDDGPTPLPYIHRGLSSRNPYANSSFVLGAIPYVVPFFKSSYGQALTHILSSFSSHPVTKAIYQATASLISFLLYLWSVLPGGKQGLNTLALALFLYALQFAYFWDPLARWFSRLFRRRNNKSPPSHDSGPSPPPSPPSSGRPGGDDNDSPPGSPKPPKDTSSAGTQTTPGNTTSAETQTTDLVTEGERSYLKEVARLQGELAQANADIGTRDITISDRDQTIKEHEDEVEKLQRQIDQAGHNLRHRLGQIDNLRDERNSIAQTHKSEIARLQAQIDTAASNVEAESDKIKHLKEAHEAQIKELQTNHDTTTQNLESGAQSLQTENDGLKYDNERLQNENNALSQQSESSSGTAENANSAEERQRLERQVRDLQEEAQSLRTAHEQHALEIDRAVAQACSQAWTDLEMTKRRLTQSQEAAAGFQKQLKKAQGLYAPPTPQVVALRNEVAQLKEALSKKEAEDAAAGEQKKLSVGAQNEQERALADCNNKVEALESTNTGLRQQNEALHEQERAAKQAEEKAKTEAEALQRQIDSLEHSLSLARAGDEAAAKLQQEIEDVTKREEALQARVNGLQQDLSQARAARDSAVRQQQEDSARAQRLRESEEQLNGRISGLEQDLLQARNAHAADVGQQQQENETAAVENNKALNDLTAALQVANNDNIRLRREFSELQKTNETILEQGREMLKQGQELETVRNQYADLNERYKREGDALHSAHESLKQAYNEQAQRCEAEKSALKEQAEKRLQYEKQNSESLRKSVKELRDKESRARDKVSALQNEVEMQKRANQNLINANNNLANLDAINQGAAMSAADANQSTNDAQVFSPDQQMEDTNPTTQPTPFTNPPNFPPPPSNGVSPSPPTHSPGPRKILIPRTARSKSPQKNQTGESKDPAQEILDWCNDIPADTTTSTSGLPNRPVATPRSTPRQSPVLPVFNLGSSRPTTPNVFETVNGPNRPIITDFTNGALTNAPVLQPNHNFSASAPGHSQNPSALGTPLDPALGGTAPPATPGVAGSPIRDRSVERAEHNARQLEIRQQRQHEERKKEGERVYIEILRQELGNFEGEYEGDDPPDAAQTSATDGNGDTDMAGAPPSSLVVGSRQEHNYLRSMPDNENGRHDALYRRHNYRSPDTLDEFESPIYYSDFAQGSDAEMSFLRSTMPANQDGRHDALYRGNNYKMPDDWDEFDNPIWY